MMSSELSTAERFNVALEHPTIGMAMRHLARHCGAVRPTQLVQQLSAAPHFPNISVGEVLAAANAAGMPLRGVGLTVAELGEVPLPALVYLKRAPHVGSEVDLIRVERLGRSQVRIADDRFGTLNIRRDELERRWAGVALVSDGPARDANKELVSYARQVELIPQMLTSDECRELIDYCEAACFRRSRVARRQGLVRTETLSTRMRSSSSVALPDRAHPVLARLYTQCATREGVETSDIEDIQCVRYKRGQRFRAHYDGGLGLPRLTTCLLYLNDNFVGGETYFPLLDLAVRPVAGTCLRFPSCDRDGRVLWPSEHGGLPVSAGVKYALNIWVRCPKRPA